MKVLLLETGRGAASRDVAARRAALDLRPEDQLRLLSWDLPPTRTPVGEQARRRGHPHRVPGLRMAASVIRVVLTAAASARIAARAVASREARHLFREADLVVSVDALSEQAAWVLASRIAGPTVLAGVPAAKAHIADVRARQEEAASGDGQRST